MTAVLSRHRWLLQAYLPGKPGCTPVSCVCRTLSKCRRASGTVDIDPVMRWRARADPIIIIYRPVERTLQPQPILKVSAISDLQLGHGLQVKRLLGIAKCLHQMVMKDLPMAEV